jgi:hypothetical protein
LESNAGIFYEKERKMTAMKTRISLVLLFVLLALPACNKVAPEYGCSETLAALYTLHNGMGIIPEHFQVENPVENGSEFDPNHYFEIFTHLSMEDGYILDYVYTFDGMGGYPTLFARPVGSAPYLSWADVPADSGDFLDHIKVDDTPEGFLQYILFAQNAEQFYLYWHSGYNDRGVVCTKEAVKSTIKNLADGDFGVAMSLGETIKSLTINQVEPVISMEDDTVTVQVTTFTMWGGFYRNTYTIQRSFPHTLLDEQEDVLVPYDCGIMF